MSLSRVKRRSKMPETVKRADYYYAKVEDRPGEGRRLLEFLSAHSVNLVAFTAFPLDGGMAQLDFIPEDAELLKTASSEAGLDLVGPKKAILIQGDDRTGVLVEYHLRLADAGINVVASNGVNDGSGRFGFVLWVKPEDYERAVDSLGI
jgi:hypothetical protein